MEDKNTETVVINIGGGKTQEITVRKVPSTLYHKAPHQAVEKQPEQKQDRTIRSKYQAWKGKQGKEARIGLAIFIIINAVAFTSGYWWAVLVMILLDVAILWKLYGKQIKEYRNKRRLAKIEQAKEYLKKQGVDKL